MGEGERGGTTRHKYHGKYVSGDALHLVCSVLWYSEGGASARATCRLHRLMLLREPSATQPFSWPPLCRFRCADLDCDGAIRPNEMWHFYEEQMKRLEAMNQEPVSGALVGSDDVSSRPDERRVGPVQAVTDQEPPARIR